MRSIVNRNVVMRPISVLETTQDTTRYRQPEDINPDARCCKTLFQCLNFVLQPGIN